MQIRFASRVALSVLLVTGLTLPASPARAAGAVSVDFVQPERFADIGFGASDRERNLEVLKRHFLALAPRLPDGQTLTIDVLEVDLAGTINPSLRTPDLRVLQGQADWPRMTLRWRLEAGGQVLRSGEDRLADLAYLTRGLGPRSGEPLAHDRRMVDEWFRERVLAPAR